MLRADLACLPESFGYLAPSWTGELLSQHLRARYSIARSPRQCRRILRTLGIARAPARRNPLPVAAERSGVTIPFNLPEAFVSRIRKARQQELALQKIRRLSSSGLPVYPFVLTLFDLIQDAIPTGDTPRATSTDPTLGSSWVFSNLDQSKWVPILSKLTEGHYSVVLVEQVEPEPFHRARVRYRYGLAPREAEVLVLLRRGSAVSQIAKMLGITTATAKTYVKNLIEKVGVLNLSTLRAATSASN